VKTIVRNLGAAGIPVLGYNFSVAGVWGHVVGPWARGGAESVGFSASTGPAETPIPNGQVWNMTYDPDAPPGSVGEVTPNQLWGRLEEFLREVVPVAEESGGPLAAHPTTRRCRPCGAPPGSCTSPSCTSGCSTSTRARPTPWSSVQGTIAEMVGEMGVYEAIDRYSRQGSIAYVHFRNVRGRVPSTTRCSSTRGTSTWSRRCGSTTATATTA
jgi:mannonate dehydratase